MSQESLERAVDQLGAAHVAAIIRDGRAYWSVQYGRSFKGRAYGQWLANQLDNFNAYSRLAVQADFNDLLGILLARGYDALESC